MDDPILPTLELLEWRIRRLQFVLHGNSSSEDTELPQGQSAVTRLSKLENGLHHLTHQYQAIYEILKLHTKYPTLLDDASATPVDQLGPTEKLATVLTDAPAFQATASQLTSLQDSPLPPLKSFTGLVSLLPRILDIEERQIAQANEITELRQRAGVLLMRWHEIFVLGQGRCWAEWDTRMKKAERSVRREEIRVAEDE